MPSHWEANPGGAEFQVKCLLDALRSSGEFQTYHLARDLVEAVDCGGHRRLNIARTTRLSGYNRLFLDAPRLFRLLVRIEPDLVYQRALTSYAGVAAYFARRRQTKFVLHIAHDYEVTPLEQQPHTLTPGFRLFGVFERRVAEYGLRRSDFLIAQTSRQAEIMQTFYGRRADRIIPNFHPLPIESVDKERGAVVVVWVANLKPFKRPELFVQLAADLGGLDRVKFLMIGACSNRSRYAPLLERIRSISNLEYLGPLPIEEVNNILARSHVFVNTSSAEGFPNTFVQAWLREVPVVSLGVDVERLLAEQAGGFVAQTYEELRARVARLCQDSTLRDAIGQRAREIAEHRYSLRQISSLTGVFSEVLGGVEKGPHAGERSLQ